MVLNGGGGHEHRPVTSHPYGTVSDHNDLESHAIVDLEMGRPVSVAG